MFRTSASTLKTAVPVLGSYKTLKSQFDWLFDGEVSHLIFQNLGPELKNLELFLRSVAQFSERITKKLISGIYTAKKCLLN
jgi:hypothetical protein